MASFTGVGDSVELFVPHRGEQIDIDISGTYDMTILFQREVGSKGSGMWQTVDTFSTANATVAEQYVTRSYNENLRLIVDVDTSGTATATLTDNFNRQFFKVTDDVGNTHLVVDEKGLSGTGLKKEVVTLDQATHVLNARDHGNRVLLLDRSGGIDVDLPEATGSGDVYEFVVVTATTDAYEISAFDVGDKDVFGVICGVDDGAEFTWGAATGNNTVTLGGTGQATGGSVGDYLRFIDISTAGWSVSGFIHQGGTEATPFSTDS